jgi:hypothetical protein
MVKPFPSKTHIGNHMLHPETLMLNYGYDPQLSEGAVKPPVFLTSAFVFKTAEDGQDFFDYVSGRREPPEGMGAGLVYSRFNHPKAGSSRTGFPSEPVGDGGRQFRHQHREPSVPDYGHRGSIRISQLRGDGIRKPRGHRRQHARARHSAAGSGPRNACWRRNPGKSRRCRAEGR